MISIVPVEGGLNVSGDVRAIHRDVAVSEIDRLVVPFVADTDADHVAIVCGHGGVVGSRIDRGIRIEVTGAQSNLLGEIEFATDTDTDGIVPVERKSGTSTNQGLVCPDIERKVIVGRILDPFEIDPDRQAIDRRSHTSKA